MKIRRWLIVGSGCALVVLAALSFSMSAPPTLADAPTSEHYQLASSEAGNPPAAMQSVSYVLNEGVALQAEVAPPMGSEHYRASGLVPHKVYLPLVLKTLQES